MPETRPSEEQIRLMELDPWQREVEGMNEAMIRIHEIALFGSKKGEFGEKDLFDINRGVVADPFNPHLSGRLRVTLAKTGSTIKGEYKEAVFVPPHPHDLPVIWEGFIKELLDKAGKIDGSTKVADVLDAASWVHTKIIRIHPFQDGNGRSARLLVDLIFIRAGLPVITDWGVARDEYLDSVDRVFREGNEDIFKNFLAEKLILRINEIGRGNSQLWEDCEPLIKETSDYRKTLKTDVS